MDQHAPGPLLLAQGCAALEDGIEGGLERRFRQAAGEAPVQIGDDQS